MNLKHLFSAALLLLCTVNVLHADIPRRPLPPKPVVIKRYKVEHRVYRIDDGRYADFDLCLFVLAPRGNDTLAGYVWGAGDTLPIGRQGEDFVVTAAKGGARFVSEVWHGETEEVTDKKVAYRLYQASIPSIQGGKVEVDVDSGALFDVNGKLVPSKGGLEGFGWFGSLGLPLVCLLGLALFFILRRKQLAR